MALISRSGHFTIEGVGVLGVLDICGFRRV